MTRRSLLGVLGIVAGIPLGLLAPGQVEAGGNVDAVTVQVTGSPLANVTLQPLSLSPTYSPTTTDYALRCHAGINAIQIRLYGAGGAITVAGVTGNTLTLDESLIENQALVIIAPNPESAPGFLQYWIRCLPHDFPLLSVNQYSTPPPGWYLTGNFNSVNGEGTYAMILDRYGTPVWYRRPAGPSAWNVTALPDGSIAWQSNANPEAWEDFSPSTGTTSWLAPASTPLDAHELQMNREGNLVMFTNPLKFGVDMSSVGGPSSATIHDCVIEEVDRQGRLVWQWLASDHISLTESTHPFALAVRNEYDPFHCNSIDIDPASGNLLISVRHADAVYLIDKTSGRIIWKMGGNLITDGAERLAILDDPEGSFHAQHDARFEPNGDVSLFDDQTWDASLAARGVEYHIDTATATASLVWSYESPDGGNSAATGSFRRLDGGTDNVIGWGVKPHSLFTEVDGSGKVLLNVNFTNGEVAYRVVKVSVTAFDHNLLRMTAGLPPFSSTPSRDQPIAVDGLSVAATEGIDFATTVGDLFDPDTTALSSDYLGTVVWGDGSSSAATITGPPGGPFTVRASHTYGEEGQYAGTIYLTDVTDPTNSSSSGLSVTVHDGWSSMGATINATEGTDFSGQVGTINESDPNAMASDYAVTLDWGDGTTSSGWVTGPQGGPFIINGTHAYAEEGPYTVGVSVADVDTPGNAISSSSTAISGDAPLSSACAGPQISPNAFAGSTARFADANPNGVPSDYTATVNWGDGSSSPGTVASDGSIRAHHLYTSTGYFTISTTVQDVGGSMTSTSCSTLIYAVPTGGTFVIGNGNSWNGSNVTFWGAQWWKRNSLAAGSAPANFKGFAQTAGAGCGVNWTTTTSVAPSAPLPAFMGVIVASSVTRSGSAVSGNAVHLVVVQTNPGYQPSPGYPGTGTVIAQVC